MNDIHKVMIDSFLSCQFFFAETDRTVTFKMLLWNFFCNLVDIYMNLLLSYQLQFVLEKKVKGKRNKPIMERELLYILCICVYRNK